jgi:hypothetical chaperone protein
MVEKLKTAQEETLRMAGIRSGEVQTVFLTGGSTALPLVRESLIGLMQHARVVDGDMFGSVGVGLAIDAQRRFG